MVSVDLKHAYYIVQVHPLYLKLFTDKMTHVTYVNQIADIKLRHFDDDTECSLSPILFAKILQQFYILQET